VKRAVSKPTAGYSGTPLPEKLGIPSAGRALLVGAPPHFSELIAPLPPGLELTSRASGEHAYIHLFTTRRGRLASDLAKLKTRLAKNGTLWVSWPKKASGVETDVTEDVVRALALDVGLVDVKVCAIDEVWSGLKLVYRLKDR
jgi:hypothetical protein